VHFCHELLRPPILHLRTKTQMVRKEGFGLSFWEKEMGGEAMGLPGDCWVLVWMTAGRVGVVLGLLVKMRAE